MKMLRAFLWILILTAPTALQAETPAISEAVALPEVKTYDELRHAISEARAQSRLRVEKAVEQERVREAWEIGRLIDAHVLQHKERADYAQHVLERLAGDLGMSQSELYRMLEFYRAYPIFARARKLSWSEYRDLLAVNEPEKREALAERAEKEGWSRDRLRNEVKALKGTDEKGSRQNASAGGQALFTAQLGKVGTYKIVKATVGPEIGRGVIDLGFSNYLSLEEKFSRRWPQETAKNSGGRRGATVNDFKEGAIIEVLPAAPEAGSAPSDKIKLSKRTPEDLYTYRAWVVNVLDGDTLKVVVDLGFGVRSVQTLRLRGIDCPELATRDGMEAKEFVEKALQIPGNGERGTQIKAGAPVLTASEETSKSPRAALGAQATSILVKTVKSDKYDRYLADIFIDNRPQTTDQRQKTSDREPATGDYLFVNQKLVDEGLAVLVEE